MIEIIEYNDEYKNLWDEYVLSSTNSHISHLLGWRNVFEKGLGHKSKYYIAIEDNKIKGIVPLMFIKTFFNKIGRAHV